MNLTDDMILKFQRGSPVFIDDICALYPATLGEIADEGYTNFQQYLSLITSSKPIMISEEDSEMKQMLKELTDFQYILLITALDPQMKDLLQKAFVFFTHETASFSFEPVEIIIGPAEEKRFLNEEKFYDFQRIIRKMYFMDQDGEEIIINPDDDPAIVKLKLKMRENREKVRKAKAKKESQNKSDLKFSDLIGSITINNCGLNMENIWNITYYAFHDQLKRMGWRDQFNINNSAALAGAKIKKEQLKHWMRSITNSD